MASGDVKGFFRQRKATGGISKSKAKPSSSSSLKKTSKPSPRSGTLGSDVVQPTTLPHVHANPDATGDDYGEEEDMLRQFDMNMAYGPCLGMSRLARWERARRLGLDPPPRIQNLLERSEIRSQCLWDGRV